MKTLKILDKITDNSPVNQKGRLEKFEKLTIF